MQILRTERSPIPRPDPCEVAYDATIEEIYSLADTNKTFEERILLPVINAANDIDKNSRNYGFTRAERHRLRTQITFDVMSRLQNDAELDAEDQIIWRQTDTPGEEWVEYTNSAGEVFGLNCNGLKYGIGKIEQNKRGKAYDQLYDRSYPYEPDYDMVKQLFSEPKSLKEALQDTFHKTREKFDAENISNARKKARNLLGKVSLAKTRESEEPPEVSKHLLRRFIGASLLSTLVFTGAILPTRSNNSTLKRSQGAALAAPITPANIENPTIATAGTSASPETTAPQGPEVPFMNMIGQEVFQVLTPAQCGLVVHVYETPNDPKAMSDTNGDGTGIIDKQILVPSDEKQKTCERLAAHAAEENAANPRYPYLLRNERDYAARHPNGAKYKYPKDANGNQLTAADFEAVGGYVEQSSFMPGVKGNIVIFAHGSTHSASFANNDALKPGDIRLIVANGRYFEYSVIGQEIVGNDSAATEAIYNYKDGMDPATGQYNNAYLTEYSCVGEDGQPGSDTNRRVVRSMFNKELTKSQYLEILNDQLEKAFQK